MAWVKPGPLREWADMPEGNYGVYLGEGAAIAPIGHLGHRSRLLSGGRPPLWHRMRQV